MNSTTTGSSGRKQALELAAALLGLLALVLYAIGWSFLHRLYARFGIEPEEAGRSWTWTVARAAVIVIPPLALVAIGGAMVGSGARGTAWVRRRPSKADRWLTWLVAGALLVVSFAAALLLLLGLGSSSPGWGVALLLTLGLIGVGYAVVRSQWALLTCAVVATVSGLLQTSRSLADEFSSVVAQDGQLQVQPFDIGPAVLEFREVRVYAPGHPLHNSCGTLLGVGPEYAIVYADVPNDSLHNYTNEVWRLPHGDAQLVYFHSGGLCPTPVGYTFEEYWPDDRPVTSEDDSASP